MSGNVLEIPKASEPRHIPSPSPPPKPVTVRAKLNHGKVDAVKQPGAESIAGKVLEALKVKPMSSPELIAAMKVPSAGVYTAVHDLKKRGLAEARRDADHQMRYFAK